MPMRAFYADHFVLPLPPGHRFPMAKYSLLRARIQAELTDVNMHEAPSAPDGVLALAHTPDYIDRLSRGALSAAEQRRIGFPWSEAMVERSRRSAGATIAACRAALEDGCAANLAGGTHHAHADHGEGFCCFNDAAVAARLMQAEGRVRRVAVIDLDVHQGNGTAAILADDPSIYTLSLHGANNFPFRKTRSDLDVDLPDGTGDSDYLAALDLALDTLKADFSPDLIIYLAGADPHEGDRLGRLRLTEAGLMARDRRVFRFAQAAGLPVAMAMAGGYGHDITQTVAVHFNSVSIAAAMGPWTARPPGEPA